jgi:hypothetical protein
MIGGRPVDRFRGQKEGLCNGIEEILGKVPKLGQEENRCRAHRCGGQVLQLKAPPESQTLKTGADLAEMSSRSHPDIERFVQLNPSYRCGDELICLARFEKTNVKASLWNKVLKL